MKTIAIIIIFVLISISIFLVLEKGNNTNNTQIDTDFITLKDTGQVALDEGDKLKIQAFVGNDLELLGNNVIINAGNEFIDLRVGDTSRIRIERDGVYINSDSLFINNVKY